MRFRFAALIATALLSGPMAAHAIPVEIFGTATDTILRGSFPGSIPGQFYGGSIAGGFPLAQTEAEARAAVLGAPDGVFLSLPGGPGVPGTAFQGAYIEIAFGIEFGANTLLNIWETGDSGEQAQLFLWTNNGGNIQPVVATNASGLITLDLSSYAGILASLGATAFTKVGVGGIDLLGGSAGFDLDAVSIVTEVPEPFTLILFGVGLLAMGFVRRLVRT